MRSVSLLFIVLLLCACGHHMTAEEIAKSDADIAKCQEAIKQWIVAHGVHPESYEPISFGQFSSGSTLNGDTPVPGSEHYTLQHTHRMLTNQGDTATFTGSFLLDNEFNVTIIKIGDMNAFGMGTYPEWEAWTDLFGRPMTREDSSMWYARSSKRLMHELEQVREHMDAGDAYVVGASDDSGKAFLDTVIGSLKQ